MILPEEEMIIEYDEVTESYYIIWEPMAAIGMGKTKMEAFDDLKQAVNFGMETLMEPRFEESEAADSIH